VIGELEPRELHNLCPLFGFVGDELSKAGGRHRHWRAAQVEQAGFPETVGAHGSQG